MNIGEMLDLPRTERSRYLAKMPLTRTFVMGCLDESSVRFFRRTIVRHGGTYREVYRAPGVFWVATFRSPRGMRECTQALVRHLNQDLRRSQEVHGHIPDEDFAELLYNENFAQNFGDVPALEFEVDVRLPHKTEQRRDFHPVTGRVLQRRLRDGSAARPA